MRNNSSKGESTQSGKKKKERTISCRINKLQEQTTKKNKKRKENRKYISAHCPLNDIS